MGARPASAKSTPSKPPAPATTAPHGGLRNNQACDLAVQRLLSGSDRGNVHGKGAGCCSSVKDHAIGRNSKAQACNGVPSAVSAPQQNPVGSKIRAAPPPTTPVPAPIEATPTSGGDGGSSSNN